MDYYSVRFTVICIVDGAAIPEMGYTLDVQVHIAQAEDYKDAFAQALAIGRNEEQTYKNGDGKDVVWRLKEIEYVRKLGPVVTGREISSRFEEYHPDKPLSICERFHPEKSTPTTDDES